MEKIENRVPNGILFLDGILFRKEPTALIVPHEESLSLVVWPIVVLPKKPWFLVKQTRIANGILLPDNFFVYEPNMFKTQLVDLLDLEKYGENLVKLSYIIISRLKLKTNTVFFKQFFV